MSDLRNMVVGITFDDNATKQIESLNKSMDGSAKGFASLGKDVSAGEKGFNQFGKTGVTSLKEVDDAMSGLRDEFSSANYDINDFGKVMAETSKEADRLGKSGEEAGKSIGQGMKGAGEGVDGADRKTSKLRNSFDELGNRGMSKLQQLGAGFNGMSGLANKAFRGIASGVTNFVTAPFRGAIGLLNQFGAAIGVLSVGGLIKSGIDRLSSIQDTRIGFEVMMGDTAKADAFMDDVLTFAKTTPFAFPELAASSKKLYAFGMKQEKIIPTMKAIGDASAMIGKGEEGIATLTGAFGDMAVSSKLSLGPISQLEDQGIPALKILANQYGVTVDDMRKKIQKGAIDSTEAIDLLVEGMQNGTKGLADETKPMAGLMEKLKKNFRGAMGDMRSSISSSMAKLIEPAMPAITKGMSWIGNQFGKLPGIINEFSNRPEVANAFANIKSAALSFSDTIKNNWPTIKDTAMDIGSSITTFIGDNIQPVIDIAVGFADTVEENWVPIKETVIGLGIAVLTFKTAMMGLTVMSTINTLMNAYRLGTLAATFAQMGLNTAMLMNPMMWVAVGIAALVAGGVALYRNFDAIKLKATELWQKLMDNPLYALAIGPIGALIAAGISLYQNWDLIKASASVLWTSLSEKWTLIQNATSTAWSSVKESISTSMANAAVSVANFFSPLLSFISTAKTAWDGFKSTVSNFKMPSFGMPKLLGGNGLIQMGSHATGLGRVPYDEYPMFAHKDESVLTADQSNALRSAGMLKGDGSGPTLDMSSGSSGGSGSVKAANSMPPMVFNITGENPVEISRLVGVEIEKIFSRMNAVTE